MDKSVRHRVFAACVAAVFALVAAAPARAELSERERQESKAQYERATRLYDVGKYAEAVEAYQKAYEIGGDPNMIYNIAQAYRLNDQPAEAARFYRRYLQRAVNPKNRDDVEKKIAEMEKLADERKAGGTTPPPGGGTVPPPALGTTGTTGPGTAPPPGGGAVPPPALGATGTTATTPPPGGGMVPQPGLGTTGTTTVPQPGMGTTTPPPGIATVPQPGLGTTGTTLPAAGGPTPTAPVQDPLRTRRIASYWLMGSGGGMLLISMITGAKALGKASQLTKDSRNEAFYDPSLQSSGQALNIVAVTTLLLALGLGGAGGYLYYTVHSQETAAAAPPAGGASVAPVVGPGTVGFLGTFTF